MSETEKRGQFRLRTLLLAIAAVASWLAWHQATSDVTNIKRELPGLRRATRELIVLDPNQFAVVEKPQIWSGEFRWEVYVPEGRSGQLHLALEGLTAAGYPSPACSLPVQPGVNVVEYEKNRGDDGWSFSLRSGDKAEETARPIDWMKRSVTTGYVQRFTETRSQSTDKPLELQRSRIRDADINTEEEGHAYNAREVQGELIWIELE